ncbi:MAG: hypothetical protein Ct9H300mP12_16100 [Acidimicrobiales bacterium]|nr:MAG: hypothetical protein Ct9H300mP12_16100 [Acidimicrobiales bacterium]
MPNCAFVGPGGHGLPHGRPPSGGRAPDTVYNRTRPRPKHGWASTVDPRGYATGSCNGADLGMVCVGNDDDLRSVVFGDHGALAGKEAGATLVDHTPASAEVAREIRAARMLWEWGSSTLRFLVARLGPRTANWR